MQALRHPHLPPQVVLKLVHLIKHPVARVFAYYLSQRPIRSVAHHVLLSVDLNEVYFPVSVEPEDRDPDGSRKKLHSMRLATTFDTTYYEFEPPSLASVHSSLL